MIERLIKLERRYYFNFVCTKCGKHNRGYLTSDGKGGLAIENYGYECQFCDNYQMINLVPRYFKTVEIEVLEQDWARSK